MTVRGAGIFGLACAHACAARGARVRVIDRAGIAAGASGGVVGALAPHTPDAWNAKKAFQLAALLEAGAYWAGVDARSGISSGYARLGRLQPVADDRALSLARAREASAAGLWQGRAEWRVVRATAGWGPVSPTGWLIHDTLTARIAPRAACHSLAGAIRDLGGEIVTGEGDEAGAVIDATGHDGLAALAADTGRPAGTGVKGQAAVFGLDRRDAPQVFADGVHIVPHADGTVAVGSTSETEFSDPTATDALLDDVIARAVAHCPELAGAPVLVRWAGVRPRARSRAPMLGPWPGRPGRYVANGGFKIGLAMAPACAGLLADLVLEGRDAIPEAFRVEASL